MAATLRAWVVEAGQAGLVRDKRRRGDDGGGWGVRVRVREGKYWGAGRGLVVFVGEDGGRVLGVGKGKDNDARGERKGGDVEKGKVVGLRAPVWRVGIGDGGVSGSEGDGWIVGVDWALLE